MPTMQVFVSHAHADNELCDRYVTALRDRGLDVWYDRTSMQDGRMLSAEIERELERRRAFVVLLTPVSVASYWVSLEISAFRSLAAHDPARLMLPVRIAQCKVPLLMAGIKWVDAVSLGFGAAVDAMAVALGAPTSLTASNPTAQELAEMVAFLEQATRFEPRNVNHWTWLGRAYGGTGRYEEAVAAYGRALALDENLAWVWYKKADVLQRLKRYEEALAAYDRALALDPNDAGAWNDKGVTLMLSKRYDEALETLDRALALDPNSGKSWGAKGHAMRKLGRDQEAEA